ncbi:MAG: DUF4349 domain-containing protein [Bacillota bacterium]
MKCQELPGDISSYLDGEMSETEIECFREHLRGCESCRRELKEMETLVTACRDLGMEDPPPDFHESLAKALESSGRQAGLHKVFALWSGSRHKALVAVAAVAAVLVMGVASGTILQLLPIGGMGSTAQEPGRAPAPVEDSRSGLGADESYSKELAEIGEESYSTYQDSAPQVGSATVSFDRKIIKSASLQVEVLNEEFAGAKQAVVSITLASGGYIQESAQWEAPYGENARFVLRVPEEGFLPVLEELRRLGKVTHEQVGGTDVTEEYVDVESRLKSLKVHEQRLLDILAKAQNVDELLRIESELSRVRSEIEGLTGRLNYLGSMVALATIEVNLASVEEVTPKEPTLWDQVVLAFLKTLKALADFATKTVVFLSGAAPVVLILVAVWYLIRRRK